MSGEQDERIHLGLEDAAKYPDITGDDVSLDEAEDDDEEVDPRVQGELETLNSASIEINTLETELEKSRNKFRLVLAESTQRLNVLFKKLGKCVLKARPYYDLSKHSKQAQAEAQKAAVCFQRANSVYQVAKEMVQLAEERNFPEDGDRRQIDAAWQEMLNHATIKFMQSEKDKADSEEEHLLKADQYATIQQKVRYEEKDMPRNISKARPYFDLKDKLEHQLQVQRMNVEDLQMGLVCSKHKYRSALTNLEAISEDIHRKRKKRLTLPPRTPGVGAESDMSSLPSIHLDNFSDTASFVSLDDLDGDCDSVKEESFCDDVSSDGTPREVASPTDGDKVLIPGTLPPGTLPVDAAPVLDKLGRLDLGQRQEVVEGSESVASSSLQEEPLSPEQLARYPGYVEPTLGVNKVLDPHKTAPVAHIQPGQSPTGPLHLPRGVLPPGSSAVPRSTSPNPGYYGNRLSLDTQKMHKSPTKRQQQKVKTQMAFPILQGLSSHMASRPAHAKVYQGRHMQAAHDYTSQPTENYHTQPPSYSTQPRPGQTYANQPKAMQQANSSSPEKYPLNSQNYPSNEKPPPSYAAQSKSYTSQPEKYTTSQQRSPPRQSPGGATEGAARGSHKEDVDRTECTDKQVFV